MDEERIWVSLDKIEKYFKELANIFGQKIPAAFVLNAGETGFRDWNDVHETRALVPITHLKSEIYISANRNIKRSTLLVGIAPDGTYLRPFIIARHKTFRKELLFWGINQRKLFSNPVKWIYYTKIVRRLVCQYCSSIRC
jgi:hypothetical protein